MGQPQDACFKQESPFLSSSTTTSTTTTIEPDFFLLPVSGKPCPYGFSKSIGSNILLEPPIQNETLTFTCYNEANYPNPCVITTQKYIKVADINLSPFDCNRYKLSITGPSKDYFLINNLDLYIKGEILDFNQPSGYYNVEINVLDPGSSQISSSVNYSVFASPCTCVYTTTTTTTTSTTTSTTTTLAPIASTGCAQLLALELSSQGAFDIIVNSNVVTASIKTVSESWIMSQSINADIWGNNTLGYKVDSFWPYAIVHCCMADPDQVVRLRFIASVTQGNVIGVSPVCPPAYLASKNWNSSGVCVATIHFPY